MHIVKLVILWALILLSLFAGGAKLFQMQQEVDFFTSAGFSIPAMIALGVVQLAGAGLAAWPPTRRWGLIAILVGLAVSTLAILLTGQMLFALASLVPMALALWLLVGRE